MSNVLLQLIETGRIQTLDGLKAAYRKAVMKTHPDAAGSNKYLESYLKLRSQSEEAKAYFARAQNTQANLDEAENRNHRLAFFEKLNQIETLEMPYTFNPEENFDRVVTLRKAATAEISAWNEELAAL
jgi:curved DNA-binding protein CbpA